jgi:hypothetical protein
MNLRQTNELNMLEATLITLQKYNSVYSGNPVMVAAVNTLQSTINSIRSTDLVQNAKSKGITLTKDQAKTIMIEVAFAHVAAGKAYATATSNTALKTTLDYSLSDLKKLKDNDAYTDCETIYNAVSPYIASMTSYGATAATLTTLQNDINTFAALIGKPRSQVAAAAAATKTVEQLIAASRTLNKDTLDPLMEQFKTSSATFYNEYHTSRIIVNVGTHKETFLEGVVTDGTNPLMNILVKVTGTKKKKLTKKNGKFRFLHLQPQKYTVTATGTNYVAFSENVMLTKDEANKITIVMLPNKSGIVVA